MSGRLGFPIEGGEKVPPGPEQSPKCAREGVGRLGSLLRRPPPPTCLGKSAEDEAVTGLAHDFHWAETDREVNN